MLENTKTELRNRGAVFLAVWLGVLALADTAYAQGINLNFLDLSADALHAIFDHKVWPIGLSCVILFELIMWGATRKLLHVIGIFIPAIAIGAWVGRAGLIQAISGFSW